MPALYVASDGGGKPRKGKTLLHYTPDLDSYSFGLNTSNFIASVNHWARGTTIYSVLDSNNRGFRITLTREWETVDVGDRRYRIDMEITREDAASGSEILYSRRFDRKVCKELLIAFRDDTEILTVYLGGRAIEITAPRFEPHIFQILEDNEESLRDIRFFTLYVPSDISDDIPIIWRKWYKDQVETGEGYPYFARAFRAFRGGGLTLFGPEYHWDSIGLWVDRPEPEDFESRHTGIMTEWTNLSSSDPAWDSVLAIEPL